MSHQEFLSLPPLICEPDLKSPGRHRRPTSPCSMGDRHRGDFAVHLHRWLTDLHDRIVRHHMALVSQVAKDAYWRTDPQVYPEYFEMPQKSPHGRRLGVNRGVSQTSSSGNHTHPMGFFSAEHPTPRCSGTRLELSGSPIAGMYHAGTGSEGVVHRRQRQPSSWLECESSKNLRYIYGSSEESRRSRSSRIFSKLAENMRENSKPDCTKDDKLVQSQRKPAGKIADDMLPIDLVDIPLTMRGIAEQSNGSSLGRLSSNGLQVNGHISDAAMPVTLDSDVVELELTPSLRSPVSGSQLSGQVLISNFGGEESKTKQSSASQFTVTYFRMREKWVRDATFTQERLSRLQETQSDCSFVDRLFAHPKDTNRGMDFVSTLRRSSRMTQRSSTMFSGFNTRDDMNGSGESCKYGACGFVGMLHPMGKVRAIWLALSLAILLYDATIISLHACFDLEMSGVLDIVQFWIRCHWTFDICLAFRTGIYIDGRLNMKPTTVAVTYIKTWLPFDLTLVTLEWIFFGVSEFGGVSVFSFMRSARALPLLRVMRLLRFVRMVKLRQIFHRLITASPDGIRAIMRLVNATMALAAYAHMCACLWHLIGKLLDADGWVARSGLESASINRRYWISLHWIIIRLQGSSSQIIESRATIEVIIDTLLLFISLILASVVMVAVAELFKVFALSDVKEMQAIAIAFIRRHHLSRETSMRIHKVLAQNRTQGVDEVLYQEAKLLKNLPLSLQEDLYYASRVPLLIRQQFFADSNLLSPRFMRHFCHVSVCDVLQLQGEDVFQEGQSCLRMLCVRSGLLSYKCDEGILSNTPRIGVREKNDASNCDHLRSGTGISEASLWTRWEHRGTLTAMVDSGMLAIDAEKFHTAVMPHFAARVFAAKYARVFVAAMNRSICCDVTSFDINMQALDGDFPDEDAGDEDHIAFISHYKVEAGTEATLMRDLMERLISSDPSIADEFATPVFVDSEDLEDLRMLKRHVEGSLALILLLTPGLLTRPWCLLEIATAVAKGIQIVPVEIQRPGISYQYPDEDFYARLRSFKVISHTDFEILKNEDVSLAQVEDAIRQVFKKIALPFSPHKSGNVRQAELQDIIKRCQ